MIKKSTSLGFKLAIIMGSIVLVSLSTVTFFVNYFMRTSESTVAESNNLTFNTRAADAIENQIKYICSSSFQLLDLMTSVSETGDTSLLRQTQALFFKRNQNIASIILTTSDSVSLTLNNNDFFNQYNIDKNNIWNLIKDNKDLIGQCCNGQTKAINTTDYMKTPSVAMIVPWGTEGKRACIIIFDSQTMLQTISSGGQKINETFILNQDYKYLIHDDLEVMNLNISDGNAQRLKELINQQGEVSQSHYTVNNKEYITACKKIDYLDLIVITIADSDVIFESVNKTTKHNLYLTIFILAFTIFVVLLYTHFGISRPLKILKAAIKEITQGNFNNSYIEMLNTKRTDEIGVLNQGITDEKEFLITFSKFTNKNVAKAIATKSIDFEPHPKDVTVFFSDIRGFTAISDDFKKRYGQDSASQIIGFLNDYMSRMVECVTLSQGNIDKFEGDAIMAVWGILRSDDLSFEKMEDSPLKQEMQAKHNKTRQTDAVNCITGSIAMRYALMEYNKQTKDFHDKPHIKIGCGINSGRASVGLMGSADKMEYTSIGDAVNFASRTEASNKICGTDILITEDTYNLIKADYIKCEDNNFTIPELNQEKEIVIEKIPVSFEVKGKGTQHFYAVVNMPLFNIKAFFAQSNPDFTVDEDCAKACGVNGPKTLNELRALLDIEEPDYGKIKLNEEENKITVKS